MFAHRVSAEAVEVERFENGAPFEAARGSTASAL